MSAVLRSRDDLCHPCTLELSFGKFWNWQPAVKISKHIDSFSDSLFHFLHVSLRDIFFSPKILDLLKSLGKYSIGSLEFHASSKAEIVLAWQFQGRCYQLVAWTMEKPPSGLLKMPDLNDTTSWWACHGELFQNALIGSGLNEVTGWIRNVYLNIEKSLPQTAILVLASLKLNCPFVLFCFVFFLMVFSQWVQLLILEFVVHESKIRAWEVLYKIQSYSNEGKILHYVFMLRI